MDMVKTLLLLLLSIIFHPHYITAKGGFELNYRHINCSIKNPNYIAKFNCHLSKNTKRRTMSMELQFVKALKSFSIDLLVVLPREHGGDFVLLNLTNLNGCQFMGNKNQVTFLQVGRSSMDRYSNLPHKCPIRGNVLYYLRGYRLDLSLMPAFAFEADMQWWFALTYEKVPLFTGYIDSRIQMRQVG